LGGEALRNEELIFLFIIKYPQFGGTQKLYWRGLFWRVLGGLR